MRLFDAVRFCSPSPVNNNTSHRINLLTSNVLNLLHFQLSTLLFKLVQRAAHAIILLMVLRTGLRFEGSKRCKQAFFFSGSQRSHGTGRHRIHSERSVRVVLVPFYSRNCEYLVLVLMTCHNLIISPVPRPSCSEVPAHLILDLAWLTDTNLHKRRSPTIQKTPQYASKPVVGSLNLDTDLPKFPSSSRTGKIWTV